MSTARTMLLLLLAAGCASRPDESQPSDVAFAAAYREREARADAGEAAPPAPPAMPPPPAPRPEDEIRGLVDVPAARLAELRAAAGDEAALAALVRTPLSRADLEALAWLRSPAVRAARERLAAVRTAYAQSSDLRDLVALYRAFLRETATRVGPERSRRATASIAPYPNVDALSGELIAKSEAIAFEDLRRVVRDVVADAERAHADAARVTGARRVLRDEVALQDALTKVARARLEAGRSRQAAVLAFEARLESLRTELAVLDDEEAAVRAAWNRLLSRPADRPVALPGSAPEPPASVPAAERVLALARTERQELRADELRAERQAAAVRLAETMTLPRMDLGTSRFERERAGEAGVQRGPVFPAPGRMVPPRSDFGVREAQVAGMRARLEAARRHRDATRDRTVAGARASLADLDAAHRRWRIGRDRLVPLAERAFESANGSYEGNETDYVELLDRARDLLRARFGLVDARRARAHARARLLQAVGVRLPEERNSR